jgi:hypothetical protein
MIDNPPEGDDELAFRLDQQLNFGPVISPQGAERRERAIRRAAEVTGFNPDDPAQREVLFGVLAYMLFPDRPSFRVFRDDPAAPRQRQRPTEWTRVRYARLMVHVRELIGEGVTWETFTELGRLLKERYPKHYHSAGAVARQLNDLSKGRK